MQIDLGPESYSALPVNGEPIFVPGAGRRVAMCVATFTVITALNIPIYLLISPFAEVFGHWFAGLFF